jgi:hypothetical protein
VVDHGPFYEILILPNHDSATVAVLPKSAAYEASWTDYLRRTALAADPPTQPERKTHEALVVLDPLPPAWLCPYAMQVQVALLLYRLTRTHCGNGSGR